MEHRIEEIRAKCNAIITCGLLDGEPYDDIKDYIAALESENVAVKAENARLKAVEADYDMYGGSNGITQLHKENARLKENIDAYAASARAIALWLKDYCNDSLPYYEMIADAARKAGNDIVRLSRKTSAFERAAHDFESATGIFSFACFCCVYKDKHDCHKCDLLGDEVCEDLENWEFDVARFSDNQTK